MILFLLLFFFCVSSTYFIIWLSNVVHKIFIHVICRQVKILFVFSLFLYSFNQKSTLKTFRMLRKTGLIVCFAFVAVFFIQLSYGNPIIGELDALWCNFYCFIFEFQMKMFFIFDRFGWWLWFSWCLLTKLCTMQKNVWILFWRTNVCRFLC